MKIYAPKILLIDDNKSIRLQLEAALADTDFQILACETGEEALEIVRVHYVDLVCCGFYLSDIEGVNLYKKFRQLPYFAHKPFVLTTPVGMIDELNHAFRAGITEIFQYDQFDELLRFINHVPCLGRKLSGRILYVEYTRSQREQVTAMLISFGLEVDACSSIAQAWPEFRDNYYDIVISDIALSMGREGIRLATQIRRQPGRKGNTPIVLLSTFDNHRRRLELLNLGINDYLIQPFTDMELYVCLSGLLQQKNQRDQDIQTQLKYQLIYENAAIGIAQVSLEGRFLEVNHYWTEMLGYSEAELLQLTFQAITHPDDLEIDLYKTGQLLQGKLATFTLEKRYIHKNRASIVWVSLNVALHCDENRQPVCFISAVQDITVQKKLRDQIAAANLQYENMIDMSKDGFWLVSNDGRILDVNQAYQRMSGYSREELLTMRINDLEASETIDQTHAHIRKIIREGSDLFESSHRTKSGTIIDLEISVTYQEGSATFLSFMRDVGLRKKLIVAEQTAREQAESALQRALTAERRLLNVCEDTYRRIGRELHDDLGQQLTGVSLLAEILHKDLQGFSTEIVEQASRISRRIAQAISTMRRLSHGLCPYNDESDLPTMLSILANDITFIQGIQCCVDVDSSWEEIIINNADIIDRLELATQLFRITQEATTNAIKHSGAARIDISLKLCAKGGYCLNISDNGRGISNDSRIEQGLGVYSMRFRANMINAILEINNNPTGGTTVSICLVKLFST